MLLPQMLQGAVKLLYFLLTNFSLGYNNLHNTDQLRDACSVRAVHCGMHRSQQHHQIQCHVIYCILLY